jgi:hypothetical protein
MPLHIYVFCWDVVGMYPKATWVMGIHNDDDDWTSI